MRGLEPQAGNRDNRLVISAVSVIALTALVVV
jgi:hypothetical protein